MNAHVLVVDDNEKNCELLTRRLTRRGFDATMATSGQRALDLMAHESFDIVLLDVAMPDMDGLEVLRRTRQIFPLTELPVLMVTAQRDNAVIVEALSGGANDYLTKPIDFPVLLARIETQLRLATQHATGPGLDRSTKPGDQRQHYCSRCATAVEGSPDSCPECSADRPRSGWPSIDSSEYDHLGQLLNQRYLLERFIGRGATGSVYRARDVQLERKFAVKIVALESENPDLNVSARLSAEIDAMASLTNPHVVRIYEVIGLENDKVALVMDYVRGTTLASALRQLGPLKPWLALDLVRQAAQGLHEAHQAGLVHRDVKPDNIMLEKLPAGGYHVKILDFGIATELGRTSGLLGTPLYMAPEQINETGLDHRTDIYALGAVLYQAFTGKPPFFGATLNQVLDRHLQAPIPKVSSSLSEPIPRLPEIDQLVETMMAKDPDKRFSSLFAVIRVIDRLLPSLADDVVLDEAEDELDDSAVEDEVVPGGQTIITGDTKGVERLATITPPPHPRPTRAVLAANTHLLAVQESEGEPRVVQVDFAEGELYEIQLPFPTTEIVVGLSPDGSHGVVSDWKGRGAVLDMKTGGRFFEFAMPAKGVTAVTVSNDGRRVAAGDKGGRLFVIERGGAMVHLSREGAGICCIAMSDRCVDLAIGREDGRLDVTPIGAAGVKAQLPSLDSPPVTVAFNRLGDLGVMLTESRELALFLPMSGTLVQKKGLSFETVLAVAFDKQDRLICAEQGKDSLQLWDFQRLFEAGVGRTTILRLRRDALRRS